MIDRSKALVAVSVAAFLVLLLVSVGFIAGRAAGGDDNDPPATAPVLPGGGLPAGPTGLEDGVPVGFAQNGEGALGAAAAWVPWLMSSPPSERPSGLDRVVADGAGDPVPEGVTARFTFMPIAGKVEMEGESQAVVTLLGPVLEGNVGEELNGEFWSFPATLEWDDSADDWRITSLPAGASATYQLDSPLDATDVEGFQALRTAGVIGGPPIVEAVPGE